MRDTSRILCALHPCKVAYSWAPIGAFIALSGFACSIEANNIDSCNAAICKEQENTFLLQTKVDIRSVSKGANESATNEALEAVANTRSEGEEVVTATAKGSALTEISASAAADEDGRQSDQHKHVHNSESSGYVWDLDGALRMANVIKGSIQNNFADGPGPAGYQAPAKKECKWLRTSTCSAAGVPTSDPGYRSCSQTVPLSEVGFCDCDGDGLQTNAELQFDCFTTPGKCSHLCQPKKIQIPHQIIMTGAPSNIMGLPTHLLDNVGKTSKLNEQMKIRYFGDEECLAYLEEYYDLELVSFYREEKTGAFRGDICRGAILYREGGFYADLDLELATPFLSLVDESTHFMSAFDAAGLLYNAFMATTPFSPVMGAYLRELRAFYKDAVVDQNMGPYVLKQALKSVVAFRCPEVDLEKIHNGVGDLQWACANESYRLYKEDRLRCEALGAADECPTGRKQLASVVPGAEYGLFDWSEPGPPRSVIGWSRVLGCSGMMCGSKGLMQLIQGDVFGSKLIPALRRRARLNDPL